ncbi:MAG: mannonate dehydratase, partial [Bacteroidota bacterium]
LHHLENGAVWPVEEILLRKKQIEEAGLEWSVVESLPVSEDIKTQQGAWRQHLENYQQSIRNLGACGIKVATYNFMPVLDWTRTDLDFTQPTGASALRFEWHALVAFDLFILQRPGAEADYAADTLEAARRLFDGKDAHWKRQLSQNIIAGLPGAEEGYTLNQFRESLARYDGIDALQLRQHLIDFLNVIVPVAMDVGVNLALHPDDPPFSILGLPRVVCTETDLMALFTAVKARTNGLCFCSGSFGVLAENNLPKMVHQFAHRIHFVHLRSTKRDGQGNFYEADHLNGDVDMCAVMTNLLIEQQKRVHRIPMRPDHGHKMLDDLRKHCNPGYAAIGRLKGLAELRGLELGLLSRL